MTQEILQSPRIFHGYDITELTIGNVLRYRAETSANKSFLTYFPDGRSFTYAEVDAITNRYANGFLACGVEKGWHVAVMMTNSPEQLFVYMALGKIGAVCVPINIAARGAALVHMLGHAEVRGIIVDTNVADHLDDVLGELPTISKIWVGGEKELTFPQNQVEVIALGSLLNHDDKAPPVIVNFTDLAYINFTSGTTGPSKGVMLTHARALLWGLSHADAFGQNEQDIVYICLPMFHVNALQGATYNALLVGASIYLQKRFSASGFWKDIRESGATVTNLLGSMVNILWSREPEETDAQNALRMVMTVPIPTFAREFEERFGLRFTSGYSLTDYGPSHAFTLSDPPEKLGSAGRLRRGMEARIVDEYDFDLPPGVPGELLIRSTIPWNSTSGYYKMEEATVESLRNGWFHTGDRCIIDQDGYMWFVDRKKDVIRRRGENISSFEVEQVILKHPAVADAAVYALPSEMSEDEVAISLTLKEGAELSQLELCEYCSERMASYMVPRFVHIASDLPRNLSQKVEKFKLREWAKDNFSSFWDRERHQPPGRK